MDNPDHIKHNLKQGVIDDCKDLAGRIFLINVDKQSQEDLKDTSIRMLGIIQDFMGVM